MKKNIIIILLIIVAFVGFFILINSNNKTSIELGDYLNLEISYEEAIITDKDVEKKMEEELSANLDYVESNKKTAENGHLVNIDFAGKLDGELFDGGSSEGYELEIGSNTFVPGFEDQIIGMKVKEIRDINITFPEQYHNEELSGKDVVFTVTLNAILIKETLPKLTDKVVQKLTDGEFKTLKAYKKHIKQVLTDEAEIANDNNKELALWNKIIENSKINKLPNKNVKYYESTFQNYYENYAANYQIDLETFVTQYLNSDMKEFKSEKEKYAKDHVTKYELAKLISKETNVTFTKEDYDNYVEKFGYNTEELASSKSYIEAEVLYEVITNFILQKTTFN